MTQITQNGPDRGKRRAAIASIITRYPAIREDELIVVIDYFRREASGLDRALIAGDRRIRRQFRQICEDHRLDRLRPTERLIALIAALVLALGGIALTIAS